MARRGSGFVMVTSLLFIAFFTYYWKYKFPDQTTIVATINEKSINMSQLKQFSRNTFGVFDDERAKEILTLMINQEVLLIHAEKQGIVKNVLKPRFDKQIEYTRERLMLENFFDIDVEGKVSITIEEIREYYDKQPLFVLRAINIPYSDNNSTDLAGRVSRELNRLKDFEAVYKMLYPNRRWVKTGNVGIANANNMPPMLLDFAPELTSTGSATKPIENEYGYTIYYRDNKPKFSEAREFIRKALKDEKENEYKINRYNDIVRNNRTNLFNIDRMINSFHQSVASSQRGNDVLVSNHLTSDVLTEREFFERLEDLYNVGSIANLTSAELLEFIDLFIGQKVILSLAEKWDYFEHPRYKKLWEREKLNLIENQNTEIVNYMIEDFHNKLTRSVTESQIEEYFERTKDRYRRSALFRLQTIITNDRATAIKAYNEAVTTGDFDTAVRKYSNDPYKERTRGIGSFLTQEALELRSADRGIAATSIYDILIKKKVGDIVQPIEIDYGVWHTYKVIGRVEGAVRPLEEVKAQVTTNLMFELMEEYIKEIVRIHKIKIKIYEHNLQSDAFRAGSPDDKPLHRLLNSPFRRRIRGLE